MSESLALRRDVASIISNAEAALEAASTPEEVADVEKNLTAIEGPMQTAGFFTLEELRRINELRMRARWTLGRLLKTVERGTGLGAERCAPPRHLLGAR
jgi:hypothetical protein